MRVEPVRFAEALHIAMKLPRHLWDDPVQSYRDVVRLLELDNPHESGRPNAKGSANATSS